MLTSKVLFVGSWRRHPELRHSCNRCVRLCEYRPRIAGMAGVFELTKVTSRGGAKARKSKAMAARFSSVSGLAVLVLGLFASGCVQSTLEVASDASLTPRDKKLLA